MTRRPAKKSPYYRQRFLCSAGEFRFYQELQKALADRFTVMFKVRAAALLRCSEADWDRWGRRVSQKEFDFVLIEKGSSFAVAAVELDDRTHELPERKRRDRFLNDACRQAGLPLVRFPVRRRYPVEHLRATVLQALASDASGPGHTDPAPALDYAPRSVRSMSNDEQRSTKSTSVVPLPNCGDRASARSRRVRRFHRQLRRRRG